MGKSILTNANDALETVAKKVEKTFEELVDMAREYIPHELDMDTVVRPCDVNIRPVYPVRYAYMNFFGDKQINAQLPPPISTFLDPDDNSLNASVLGGYSIRLPRAGWIYVKEEGPIETRGSQHEGKLLIFKFSPEIVTLKGKRGMVTKYTKYEQKAGSSSWEEIHPASGTAGLGYPFLALDKDVTKVSIVYSEVPFSERILDKIDKDESFRRNAMQFVELDHEGSDYVMEAKQEHFDGLVEDFKVPEKQFQAYKNQLSDPLLHSVDLGDISTEGSFFMDADMEMRYIDSLLCPYYKDKASIVVLHDPVGYQRDILMAYELLNLWELSYSATNIYPLTIGQFVEIIAASKDENIKKCFKEHIHQENWKTWWPKLTDPIIDVKKRQKEILEIYKEFFESPNIAGKLGSLSHYLKYFFSLNDKKSDLTEEDGQEFEIYCDLIAELMQPLQRTAEGTSVLEYIIGGKLALDESSSWSVINNGIVNTLGHDGANKLLMASYVTKGIDKILCATGEVLGMFLAWSAEKIAQGSVSLYEKSIEKVNQTFTNKILNALGVEEYKGFVLLTEKEVVKLINDLEKYQQQGLIGKSKRWGKKTKINFQKKGGKAVFNWSNRIKNYTGNLKLKIPTIKVNRPKFNIKFLQHYDKPLGIVLDSSLSGFDLIMKSHTFYTLLTQSGFDRNDPWKANRKIVYLAFTYLNTILGMAIAARSFSEFIGKGFAKAESLARKINHPAAEALLGAASRRLMLNSSHIKLLAKGAVGVTGVLSGALSYYDAYYASALGSHKEAYAHVAIGTGTLMITAGFLGPSFLGTGAGAAGAGAFFTGMIWAGILGMLASIVYLFFFGKSQLEYLLMNCFWGSGNKYSFLEMGSKRPKKIEIQFDDVHKMDDKIINAFKVEHQEFLNFFTRPILKKESNNKGKMVYRFMLPNFQWERSELIYHVLPSSAVTSRSDHTIYVNERYYANAKQRFDELMEKTLSEIIYKNENPIDENGMLTLTLEIEEIYAQYLTIFWYYMPKENDISPLRYQWGEEPTVENAIYGYFDEKVR
ncbi:toxin VasX [Xenorhabdus griffiniae]|uniref:toxin VasX n=1 Tax=Xenorhabdus griffiniae TaxID=351672 RepID=UPI0030D136C4